MSLSQRQSEVISALRFPLMLLVVFIHVPLAADYFRPLQRAFPPSATEGYYYVSKIISYTIGHIAVPAFFVFSGYYMFAKSKAWSSWMVYKQEITKRIRTLLIPYLIWCTIPLLISLCLDLYSTYKLGELSLDKVFTFSKLSHAYLSGPINFPLWYMRDLIILSLFAPLVALIIKRAPILIVLPFGLMFFAESPLLQWLPAIPSMTSISYFLLGAVLGSRHIDMIKLVERGSCWLFPLFVLSSLLVPFAVGHEYFAQLIVLYTPIGVGGILCSGAYLMDHAPRWHHLALRAEESVFFVYVSHEVMILSAVKGLFYRLGILETIPGYLLAGILIYVICVMLFYALRKVAGQALVYTLGGRS